jgi:hypothetical protein
VYGECLGKILSTTSWIHHYFNMYFWESETNRLLREYIYSSTTS